MMYPSRDVIVLGGGHHSMAGLGLVANGERTVTPVPSGLLKLVPYPEDNNITVKPENAQTLRDTIPLMLSKIKRTTWQTKKLAVALKGKTLLQTLRNDWTFIFKHIQYKEDERGKEQLRSPRRLIHEGVGDCDCFSCTIGSLLINQKIPAVLRIAKYARSRNPSEYSHVYIVVPKNGNVKSSLTNRNDYYTIDPVVHEFDYEEPYSEKKDFPINKSMELQYLDGFAPSVSGLGATERCHTFRKNKGDDLMRVSYLQQEGIVTTGSVLQQSKACWHIENKPDGGVQYIVTTPAGEKLTLPPILGQQDLRALQDRLAIPAGTDPESPKGGKNVWGWIAAILIAGTFLIVTSDESEPEEKQGTNGLSGPAKRKAKRKLRTIKM